MAGEKHLYLVARGSYTITELSAEKWQCGIRLWADLSVPELEGTLPNTGDYAPDDTTDNSAGEHVHSEWKWTSGVNNVMDPTVYLHDTAGPAWADFMAATAISAHVQLDELRLYPMESNGKAFDSRVAVLTYDSPPVGGRGSDVVPTELSVVSSLRTNRPGPKGRGRIYLPPTSSSGIAATSLVNGTMVGDQADATATLMSDLAVESVSPTGTHMRPIVTGKPWTQYAVITSVDVGNIFDAQRRRRRSLEETRETRAVTYG